MPAPNSSPLALSVYATVLYGLDADGQLDELARCSFRVGEGTFGGELHAAVRLWEERI
ncbi:hypothetical protein [Bradyrhizobium sp. UFLA05-112]